MSVHEELVAAKIRAVNDRPYFASAINALIHVEKPGLGTLACDEQFRLYFDPAVFTKWSNEELASVIVHEIGHLLREHHQRARIIGPTVNGFLWNIAGDLEINDDLVAEGMKLPGDACLPKKLGYPDGEVVESYYQKLIQDQKAAAKAMKQCGGDEDGDGDGKQPMPGMGRCGSCATGNKESWDEGGKPGADGEATPGVSRAEAELIGRQVARDIMEAEEKGGKQAGNIAGGWKRWAKERMRSKVNYNAMIRAAIRGGMAEAEGKMDYSYRRPNRRQNAFGHIIMPGMRAPRPRVGIGIDTSGSMSQKQLEQCMGEIRGALTAIGQSGGLFVASCDYACQPAKQIFNIDQIDLVGGGGTDMGAAIAVLSDIKPKLGLMILLTDCETPWPAEAPEIPLVLIKVAGSGAPPPWPVRSLIEIDVTEY